MLRLTTSAIVHRAVSKQHDLHQVSISIWIRVVWPLFRNTNDTHPVLQPYSIFLAGEYLSRLYLSGILPSFYKSPLYSVLVTSCIFPEVWRGLLSGGCCCFPPRRDGAEDSTSFMQTKQWILSQPSYLCLKMQIHQRTKGKGWGLLR